MRTCSICKSKFNHYGQRSSFCRECRKAYDRAYYAKKTREQRDKKNIQQRNRIRRNKKFLSEYKLTRGCTDCGYNKNGYALDFDHLPESLKSGNLSTLAQRQHSIESLLKEIEKCDVVCCNCHRLRTLRRRGIEVD